MATTPRFAYYSSSTTYRDYYCKYNHFDYFDSIRVVTSAVLALELQMHTKQARDSQQRKAHAMLRSAEE